MHELLHSLPVPLQSSFPPTTATGWLVVLALVLFAGVYVGVCLLVAVWVRRDAGATLTFGWYLPRLLALSVLLTWVFDHTRGSVLHAVLLHAAVNGTEAFVSASLDTPLLEPR